MHWYRSQPWRTEKAMPQNNTKIPHLRPPYDEGLPHDSDLTASYITSSTQQHIMVIPIKRIPTPHAIMNM